MLKYLSIFLLFFTITSCSEEPKNSAEQDINQLTAGTYVLDRTHASVTLRVDHLWFSKYTMNFKRFDAQLNLDPKKLKEASVFAVIDSTSLETGFLTSQVSFKENFVDETVEGKARNKSIADNDHMRQDFNTTLVSKQWLDAEQFPKITFVSKKVEITSKTTAKVIGELTLHGVTKMITLDVRFNGGYDQNSYDPFGSRIGFSGRTKIKRSDFGVTYGLPEKDSRMGVSDEVEVIIEAEFIKPKIAS